MLAMLVNVTWLTVGFTGDIAIVNGVYHQTYNCGGHLVVH